MNRRFTQIDVFTAQALSGNPLAVVHDAQGLDSRRMQAFTRWMNLSETSFLLPPENPQADYRVRIFTPDRELPFAGHPTLGSCQAWLAAGGIARQAGTVVQECQVGLVHIRREGSRLAFAAPPLIRTGPVAADDLARIAAALRIEAAAIRAAQWVDNGPGWVAVMLGSREELLALRPDFSIMKPYEIGAVAPCPAGHEAQFEVRAFFPGVSAGEDPVTGSLNASVAQWLIGAGLAPDRYVASQGTCIGRAGRVHLQREGDTIWVGGDSVICVRGEVEL